MDVQKSAERFNQAASTLPDEMCRVLLEIPVAVKAKTFEIRLRTGRPIALTAGNRCWFVDKRSQLSNAVCRDSMITAEQMQQAVVHMCGFSIHSHEQEFLNGFIALRGGHRAGICGTAVLKDGQISAVRDITSINLRVAREVYGTATTLVETVLEKSVVGMLIIGIPSSGKTTILRDLAKQLADGKMGQPLRVAVVDERGELGAVFEGVPQNDLGACCDILTGYPKGVGILTAVRTLSPQVILCDEIGAAAEVDSILDSLNCGVKVIATAHAANIDELLRRKQIRRLLENGAFDKIVQLGGTQAPGSIEQIIEVGGLFREANGNDVDCSMRHNDRRLYGRELV